MPSALSALSTPLADQINSDPICRDKLQVVFLENYRVSMAEMLMPASEVNQQISTAGKEASGTGQHEVYDERRLTLGTLDGANVEMHQVLGGREYVPLWPHRRRGRPPAPGYRPLSAVYPGSGAAPVLDQLKIGFRDGVSYEDLYQRLLPPGGPVSRWRTFVLLAASPRVVDTYADREKWSPMACPTSTTAFSPPLPPRFRPLSSP